MEKVQQYIGTVPIMVCMGEILETFGDMTNEEPYEVHVHSMCRILIPIKHYSFSFFLPSLFLCFFLHSYIFLLLFLSMTLGDVR